LQVRIVVLPSNSRKYGPLVSELVKLPFDELVALGPTPKDSLTLLLLLDQLPRNFSRGDSFPFDVCDPVALKLAQRFTLEQDHDKQHPPFKMFWYYLPFVHAESIAYQELALAKFADACWALRDGEWKDYHEFMQHGLESAWKHYTIISKFRRFPARNTALGREPTEEEKYLKETEGSFE
jgi:uncharacterized protein (DUF924 family)